MIVKIKKGKITSFFRLHLFKYPIRKKLAMRKGILHLKVKNTICQRLSSIFLMKTTSIHDMIEVIKNYQVIKWIKII
ncbi:MAG TPA: hypothetical protein DEP40_04050 [Enterococcus sp.]|nr:hypothetical protein LIANG_01770 [Enterococcus durans]HCB27542.1 hypothetical protein [Enterococcus sp.]